MPQKRTDRTGRSGCKFPDEHEFCYYCNLPLYTHEDDHFPIPARAGGTRVVPACLRCHDMKDQNPIAGWHIADIVAAWNGQPALCERLWTSLAGLGPAPQWTEQEINELWPTLNHQARIFLAKAIYLIIDRDGLPPPPPPVDLPWPTFPPVDLPWPDFPAAQPDLGTWGAIRHDETGLYQTIDTTDIWIEPIPASKRRSLPR